MIFFSAIPYTVRVRTGDERDQGTDSNVWIKILGRKKKHTGRQFLELAQKRGFMAGSVETFSLEAPDVDDVKMIEVKTLCRSWISDVLSQCNRTIIIM